MVILTPNRPLSFLLFLAAFRPFLAPAQIADPVSPDVLTFHADNARTGHYSAERTLTPQNVNAAGFGKLFTLPVDGKVDAQPLYAEALPIAVPPSGQLQVRNVVFAATEHDSVYAFDAATGLIYWQVSLLGPGETSSDALSCTQVTPEIGITATPVIDRTAGSSGTIYLVAMSKDAAGNYHQRLHALDLVRGIEQPGSPVEIQASYPGTGQELNANGQVIFNPKQHEERSPLLLMDGVVYTSWTSHCDHKPYTGWAIAYDQRTLRQTGVFNFAPNGSEASIWNSGSGPAADSFGSLYFSVANGTFDTTLDPRGFPSAGDYGNTYIKLRPKRSAVPSRSFFVVDYWTMFNTTLESSKDLDLGSGGIVLLPDLPDADGNIHRLAVGAGKDANVYVIDRDNLGKFNPTDNSNIYQQIPAGLNGRLYAQPAWFNGTVYIGAVGDSLRAFSVSAARLDATPVSTTAKPFPYPGTNPVISSDQGQNAILWAFENSSPAVLHAFDPANLKTELYNSNQAAGARDQFGPGNKFISPIVAGGRVYIGTTNSVAVFGLLSGR